MPCVRSVEGNGLGAWGLLSCEGFEKALIAQILIPQHRKLPVLVIQFVGEEVLVTLDRAAPLLDSEIVIAVVEGVEVRPSRKSKLEAHLRVTDDIPVQFAVLAD